jgi:HEAT repeat protein
MNSEICFDSYLKSVKEAYQKWEKQYTLTDVTGRSQHEELIASLDVIDEEQTPDFFDFKLIVQTMQPLSEDREKSEGDRNEKQTKEKTERLPVLEEICKYAADHVLLIGRPGSGKSTALERLLLQEAKKAICDPQAQIPVLVELRYLPSEANELAVGDRIRTFMLKHDPALPLDVAAVENLLRQGRLLLLVDGVNELPSDRARHQVNVFRQDYQKTYPMIFTTRELSAGGDLGIVKKLEMQPLTEPQMQQFVMAHLPTQGEKLLRQLSGRLREFGQTPLLLWMLCSLFRQTEQIPPNLGMVFRTFTLGYGNQIKQDVLLYKDSRVWWGRLLQYLAFVMIVGESATEARVTILRWEAERVLVEFLQGKVEHPDDCAIHWLEDLLNHHLLQVSNDQIEFRHQLIQEYYAAEWLLGLLPSLSDERLQHDYLNYLKWTEPLALMLELVESEELAVRVVRLTLEVDLSLGARLAGAVKYGFQEKTVGLIYDQHLPPQIVIYLLGLTRSEKAIPYLKNKITLTDSSICTQFIKAIGKVPTQNAIDTLKELLNNFGNDEFILGEIALAFGEIGTQSAVSFLEDWNDREELKGDEISYLKSRIEIALWEVHGDSRKPMMFQQIIPDYSEQDFQREHGEINLDNVIKFMESEPVYYDDSEDFIKKSLTKFKDKDVIPRLAKVVSKGRQNAKMLALEILCERQSVDTESIFKEALNDEISFVREVAISGLAKIGNNSIIPTLVKLLLDKDRNVRDRAIRAFGKIGGDKPLKMLTELFKENQTDWFELGTIAKAIGDIGREESIDLLISKLDKGDDSLSSDIVEALGSIGGDKAIKTLVQLLKDKEFDINDNVVETLKNISQSDLNLSALTQQLPNLFSLVPTEASQQALSVITTIQSRCKYYNYDISQMTLPPEDKANSTTGNTFIFHEKVAQVIAGDLIVHGDNSAT